MERSASEIYRLYPSIRRAIWDWVDSQKNAQDLRAKFTDAQLTSIYLRNKGICPQGSPPKWNGDRIARHANKLMAGG